MTPERIAELRALDAARTPGQWVTERGNYSFAMRQLGTTGYSGIIWDYECNPSQDDAAFITATSTAIPELLDALEAKETEKNNAYHERNRVVAALAKLFPSGILDDMDEEGWFVVYIDLPTGQASWHFQASELPLFSSIPIYEGQWDGHTTEEKYQRLAKLGAEGPKT